MTDLLLVYTPSVSVLHPNTPDAADWCATHLDPNAPRMGDGYALDNRTLETILEALDTDGFTLGFTHGH